MDLFNFNDFWFQFEWQLQGSGYIYGFLQSLLVLKPDLFSDELRVTFTNYWAAFVSMLNPN